MKFGFRDVAFVASAQRPSAGGGEPPLPTTDPNIWAFYRSDMGIIDGGGYVVRQSGGRSWDDQSVNARHLEQNVGQECLFTTSGPNGHAAVYWDDATNKFMRVISPGDQPYALFALMKPTLFNDNRYFWDGPLNFGALIYGPSSSNARQYAGSFGNQFAIPLGSWSVVTCIYDNASSVAQVNNDTEVTSTIGTINPGGLLLGSYNGGGSNSAAYQLAALVRVSGHPDASARSLHKTWLAWFGGVTL